MDTNLLSMSQQFSGLPMESLIGGPLNAAAKANSAMALTQTMFMLDTCFSKKKISKQNEPLVYNYEPIMIDMILTRSVVSANKEGKVSVEPASTKFTLPLLTILPINSLAVETVDINFEMEVKSSFSEDNNEAKSSETEGGGSFETKIGWGLLSTTIKGSASYSSKDSSTHDTHYEKSNSAKYTVNVHAGQLPLPKGVNTIIEAFAQAIQPIELTPAKGEGANGGAGVNGGAGTNGGAGANGGTGG